MPDTAALQALIDAVNPVGEVIEGTGVRGGVVQLERRKYSISAPLNLYSGIILRGHGIGGTIIRGNGNFPLLRASYPAAQHFTYHRGIVEDMRLVQEGAGKCYEVAAPVGGGQGQWQGILRGLLVSAGGVAIDLASNGAYCQNGILDDIGVCNGFGDAGGGLGLGNTMIHLNGVQNTLSRIDVHGSVRSSWVNGQPIIRFSSSSENVIRESIIEPTFNLGQSGYALHHTGGGDFGGNFTCQAVHFETRLGTGGTITNNVDAIFEDTPGLDLSMKLYLTTESRVHFKGLTWGTVRLSDLTGGEFRLSDLFLVDDTASINFDMVTAILDAGWLDKANVNVRTVRHRNQGGALGPYLLRNPLVLDGNNLVKPAPEWRILPDVGITGYGVQAQSGNTLEVRVDSVSGNPSLWVHVPLRLSNNTAPANVARWKATAPAGSSVLTYTDQAAHQLATRAKGSVTQARLPVSTTHLLFQFNNVVPGTYRLENVTAGVELGLK